MSAIIKVEALSKRYRLGLKEIRKDTLVGQIAQTLRSPLNNLKQLRSMTKFNEDDESVFWALQNLNFEVKQGEVLGIIGHNGAGKSTLLKVLSRITEPTNGRILIYGRVAALLEVGTGFHQDLTGRENIYMNGTVLGMTRREIDRKLDEIVDFSGVEKHLDTPVKFYSSGMKVRLGFAVAAHLEPEILIVDEVLSVGDMEFQRKCLGKMESVASAGRTVLFVSHNMGAVKSLCQKGLVLNRGRVQYYGGVEDAINTYVTNLTENLKSEIKWSLEQAPGDDRFKALSIRVAPTTGNQIDISSGITIESECLNMTIENALVDMTIILKSADGVELIHHGDFLSTQKEIKPGRYHVAANIPSRLLNKGIYSLKILFGLNMTENLVPNLPELVFEVLNADVDHLLREMPGVLRPNISYKSEYFEVKHNASIH